MRIFLSSFLWLERWRPGPCLPCIAFVPQLKSKLQDDTLLITTERNFQRMKDIKPMEHPGLVPACRLLPMTRRK